MFFEIKFTVPIIPTKIFEAPAGSEKNGKPLSPVKLFKNCRYSEQLLLAMQVEIPVDLIKPANKSRRGKVIISEIYNNFFLLS